MALTRYFAKLSISPESSDGLASVGAILPKEKATLLPGGLFLLLQARREAETDGSKLVPKGEWQSLILVNRSC